MGKKSKKNTGKNKTQTTVSKENTLSEKIPAVKFLLLALPFAIIIFMSLFTVGATDGLKILLWYAILFLFSLITLPLAFKIFKNFGSGGFLASKVMGLVLVSLIDWTLTYLKIYRFSYPFVIVCVIAVAFFCYFPRGMRKNFRKKLSEQYLVENIVIEESVFAAVLVFLCFLKGFSCAINGEEKFMDYGFIMSMLRNPSLPAKDMWLAGLNINYYYFGQFIWALAIKLSCIKPAIGYNLAMCSAIAIPFGMAFSFGKMLIEGAEMYGMHKNRFMKYVCGLIAGLSVVFFGNSHSFFYDENGGGNAFLNFLKNHGFDVGRTDEFFYPDSTRFIGWNPETGNDYTIEEFPFYSYLVGDLHAHVISMMTVLLIAMIMLALITRTLPPDARERDFKEGKRNLSFLKSEYKNLLTLELIFISILLGVSQMTNYWDFLIYFIFCSMGFLVVNTRRSENFSTLPSFYIFVINVAGILGLYLLFSENVILHIVLQATLLIVSYVFTVMHPAALTRTSFDMSVMFTVSLIVASPFNYNFDMISNALGKVQNRSSLFQLWILWGTHLLICLTFFVVTVVRKNLRVATAAEEKSKKYKPSVINTITRTNNPIATFFDERNLVDVFVCGMIIVAIMLLVAPEIFYVRDIYTSGYLRANTMFKFAFAAFIILSVSMAYSIVRLFWIVNKKGLYSLPALIVAWVYILMLFIPAHYTSASLDQRVGEIKKENYVSLDGIDYLDTYNSSYSYIVGEGNLVSYKAAIEWLNENVEGSPVICEAYGESYTDYNIVSAYTGLPTVIGWQTHEWLWRFHGIVNEETDLLESDPDRDVWVLYITPRYNDVDIIYSSTNTEEIQELIDKYQIEYIILGNIEYFRYGYDNTETIKQLGEAVFTYDNLNIFKVTPQS